MFPWKGIIIVGSVWCDIRFKWKWVTRINNENKIVVCTSQGWEKIMLFPLGNFRILSTLESNAWS